MHLYNYYYYNTYYVNVCVCVYIYIYSILNIYNILLVLLLLNVIIYYYTGLWGHPHCSSPSSVQFFARQHSNTLSEPSAVSHHGTSTSRLHSTCHAYWFCQLTSGRAGQTARSQYEKGHSCNRNSTPTPGRRHISKDQQHYHQEGLASCHIKN